MTRDLPAAVAALTAAEAALEHENATERALRSLPRAEAKALEAAAAPLLDALHARTLAAQAALEDALAGWTEDERTALANGQLHRQRIALATRAFCNASPAEVEAVRAAALSSNRDDDVHHA